MRILVIGHSGQLASALREAALPTGWKLHTLGRPILDVRNGSSLGAAMDAFRPDVVINTAAFTAVDAAENDIKAAFELNRDTPARIAHACAQGAIPIVHISSDYVFDGSKGSPYTEEDPPHPLNVYGCSKLAGEEAIREAGAPYLIVRTAWLFGPHGNNFLRTILRLSKKGTPLRIVADRFGTPTCSLHLATALISLLARWHTDKNAFPWNRTWHIAGSGHASWYDLARTIMQTAHELGMPAAPVQPIASVHHPARAPRPRDSRLDCSAIAHTLGLHLPPWQEGVTASMKRLLPREISS